MAPAINLTVRDEVEDQTPADDKANGGQCSVKETKNNKPPPHGSGARQCGDEEDESRSDMQYVVRGVYHEETKEHFVFGYAGNETENSSEQEKESPQQAEFFNHDVLR